MPNYKVVNGVKRALTEQEQALLDQRKATWLAEKPSNDLAMLRAERDQLLAETDYLALSDNTMTDAMASYRQALRDITNTYTSLDDVVWPTKPQE